MKASEFYSAFSNSLRQRKDVVIKKYRIKYGKGKYDFLRIASKRIRRQDQIILIRAGIHGNEIAGPLTILFFCNQIIDCVHQAGLKCIIYPLGNPRGFEQGARYNIDWREGNPCNNDFLRYELEDGAIVENIGKSSEFKRWHWLSDIDKKLRIKLPEETKLMHKLLKKDLLPQVAAFLDLHQDFETKDAKPRAYHYSFGDLRIYEKIVSRIEEILPVSRNELGTDGLGFLTEHDGSLDDLMHRLGAKYCVTCETTGVTPLGTACLVNLTWIRGIVDLASGR